MYPNDYTTELQTGERELPELKDFEDYSSASNDN